MLCCIINVLPYSQNKCSVWVDHRFMRAREPVNNSLAGGIIFSMKYLFMCILPITALLGGCIIGEQRKQWDLESSRLDQELTIKKITSPAGSAQQKYYDDSPNDLNYKWYIDLRPESDDIVPSNKPDDERIDSFNKTFEKQLHQK